METIERGTTMKNGILADQYYDLLEWKDANHKTFQQFCDMQNIMHKPSLNDFDRNELRLLYFVAFRKDIDAPKTEEKLLFLVNEKGFNRYIVVIDSKSGDVLHKTEPHHPDSNIYFEYKSKSYLYDRVRKWIYKFEYEPMITDSDRISFGTKKK